MSNTTDEIFASYWQWLLSDFQAGRTHEYSPTNGNTRRIEYMDERTINLREITPRQYPSSCTYAQLLADFQVLSTTGAAGWTKSEAKTRGVKDFVEFKRDMFFREFMAFQDTLPTADPITFEHRVSKIIATGPIPPPAGVLSPERSVITTSTFVRDPRVKAWVLLNSGGRCEGCGSDAPFERDSGEPFLEVHHVLSLVSGGPDTIDNCVAVCPNCHRRAHFGRDRVDFTHNIYERYERLVRG